MGSPCSVGSRRSSARCFCTSRIGCRRRRSAHPPNDGDHAANDAPQKREREERRYLFPCFLAATLFAALALPSARSALRTCLNTCREALSVRGNRRFRLSSVLTIAEPITTRANHL